MRNFKPFVVSKRTDSKTYRIALHPKCGLPARVCDEWHHKSFANFPAELTQFMNPKTYDAAEVAALALIEYLKKKQEEGGSRKITIDDITVGAWLERFTSIETSPRTGINAAKNRPNSQKTLDGYKYYYDAHIKGDPLTKLKMMELEEDDITEFCNRLSRHKKADGSLIGGTRTSAGVVIFIRMAFKNFQKKFPRWYNPFSGLEPPKLEKSSRVGLSEEEVLKLFKPGVLKTTMELAVCSIIFWAGLRRAEVAALHPDDLDWVTPKITVRHAWQNYDKKNRVLGPPKGKRQRDAPFDPIVQEAIKKLWKEQGQPDKFVFSYKGSFLPPQWTLNRFPGWLKDAGIKLNGRDIVPHSSRHSLASILEDNHVSLRYIQELLGHSDLETTKIYLHTTGKTIRNINKKITKIWKEAEQREEPKENIIDFKVS